MHKKGHYGATLLGYAPLGAVTLAVGFEAAAVTGGAVAVALAMVPDLDMKIPGVAHRGVTHTVRFALAIGAVTGTVGVALAAVGGAPVAVAVGAGVFGFVTGAVAIGSHIAADALTPMGVELFVRRRTALFARPRPCGQPDRQLRTSRRRRRRGRPRVDRGVGRGGRRCVSKVNPFVRSR